MELVRAGTGPRGQSVGTTEAFHGPRAVGTMVGMDRHRLRRLFLVAPAILLIGGLLTPAALAATDSDHDGLPNTWERTWSRTSPYRADSNGNGSPTGARTRTTTG